MDLERIRKAIGQMREFGGGTIVAYADEIEKALNDGTSEDTSSNSNEAQCMKTLVKAVLETDSDSIDDSCKCLVTVRTIKEVVNKFGFDFSDVPSVNPFAKGN